MGKQFANVNARYGAPMGRTEDTNLETELARSVRLFRVNLDSGGYDDGGAYWGTGKPLFCAVDCDGSRQFVRAWSRESAAFILGIGAKALKVAIKANGAHYGLALIDGRAPMPEIRRGAWGTKPAEKSDVIEWMEASGHHFGRVAA